VRGKT